MMILGIRPLIYMFCKGFNLRKEDQNSWEYSIISPEILIHSIEHDSSHSSTIYQSTIENSSEGELQEPAICVKSVVDVQGT